MELFKNFAMGGLFQAAKRMSPPWGTYRRFTNAFKDRSGSIKPFGKGSTVSNTPTVLSTSGATGFTHLGPLTTQKFRQGILQFHAMKSGSTHRGVFSYLGADNSLATIMQPYKVATDKNCVVTTKHMTYLPSSNFSTCTVARKAYMNSMINTSEFLNTLPFNGYTPEENYLMAFDGIRCRGAGLPLPWTHIDYSGVPAAHYARVVYVTIGMDGEAIFSPYMEQQVASSSPTIYLSGYSAYPGTKRGDVVGGSAIFPPKRGPTDHLFEETTDGYGKFGATGSNVRYFDKRYILHSSTTAFTVGGTGILTMTNAQSIGPGVDVGDWIMCYYPVREDFGTASMFNGTMMMFQVATIVGSTVTFSKDMKYLDEDSVSWIDADFKVLSDNLLSISPSAHALWLSQLKGYHFSNIYMIVSYSTTQGSGYRVAKIYPVCWEAPGITATASSALASPHTFNVPWLGVVSSYMSDWYDTNEVKTTFPPLKGITNYKDLLVGFDNNAIYFNDITLGGSTEMVGGLSNMVPFGSEYGDIVAICGSEDFLFISRERKNYILTGDLAGTNFSLFEVDFPVQGAYNTKCTSNAWAGQVIFANASGIFSVTSSGEVTNISQGISDLFNGATNRDENLFDKSVFKTLGDTRSSAIDGSIFKFFLEENRGFVVLLTAKASSAYAITGSNMLVYSVDKKEWYEFDGNSSTAAESFFGKIYSLGTSRYKEDGVMRGSEKQLLVSQWLTVDSPSLEKQILQLKMFMEITPKTSDSLREITIGQQNDWAAFVSSDRSLWTTNVVYTPDSYEVYYHKKRLNSSKPLATSIIMESLPTGSFTLEGAEIEGVVVQQGMKK